MNNNEEKGVWVRGIRGAIKIERNNRECILKAVKQLLESIVLKNNLEKENIISVFFTVTKDINAEFPAYALREMGWKYVPALCAREIDVPRRRSGQS